MLVDVGRQQIEGRGGHLPDSKDVVGRTAAFVGAGGTRGQRVAQRGVCIHRKGVFLLARRRHLPDEARDRPGMEILVGIGAEGRRPVCANGCIGAQRLEEFPGNGFAKKLFSRRRKVPHAAPAARLVLHLNHDHRALGIHLLEVAHERAEGAQIGLERGGRVGRGRVHAFPVLPGDERKLLGLRLRPKRNVVRAAVFPCGEPQQDQPHLALPRLLDDQVDDRRVVLSRLGLELFPVDGDLERVGVQIVDGGPDLRQQDRPGAGVVALRPEDQEGRAVHEQGETAVLLDELWNRRLFRQPGSRQSGEGRSENEKPTDLFHSGED